MSKARRNAQAPLLITHQEIFYMVVWLNAMDMVLRDGGDSRRAMAYLEKQEVIPKGGGPADPKVTRQIAALKKRYKNRLEPWAKKEL